MIEPIRAWASCHLFLSSSKARGR